MLEFLKMIPASIACFGGGKKVTQETLGVQFLGFRC